MAVKAATTLEQGDSVWLFADPATESFNQEVSAEVSANIVGSPHLFIQRGAVAFGTRRLGLALCRVSLASESHRMVGPRTSRSRTRCSPSRINTGGLSSAAGHALRAGL